MNQQIRPKILSHRSAPFQPHRVIEIELSHPLPVIQAKDEKTGKTFSEVRALMRLHSQPIGQITWILNAENGQPEKYAAYIWKTLGPAINQHLAEDHLSPVSCLPAVGIPLEHPPACRRRYQNLGTNPPFISVVIPTRDRPENLDRCLQSLIHQDYPLFEIIIVDTPSSPATWHLWNASYAHLPRFHYLCEPHPGISLARNRGLDIAQGEIVFFTDDDTIVDRNCLSEVAQVFIEHPQVACITGLVVPYQLETQAQLWFEHHTGSGKGVQRQIFDLKENRPAHPLFPYACGIYGAGVHRAFRTKLLRAIGGFDRALGPGSLGAAAEDFDVYFRILEAGHQIAYEPRTLVYHSHRLDYAALQRQISAYYVGIACFLTKCIITRPERVWGLLARLPDGIWYLFSGKSEKNHYRTPDYPKKLIWIEWMSFIYGFVSLAYIRSKIRLQHEQKNGDVVG